MLNRQKGSVICIGVLCAVVLLGCGAQDESGKEGKAENAPAWASAGMDAIAEIKNKTAEEPEDALASAEESPVSEKESPASTEESDVQEELAASQEEAPASEETAASTEEDQAWLSDWQQTHERVKGIYVTGPVAGSSMLEDIIALLDETELNTLVIDYKNDEGRITAGTDAYSGYIRDLDALLAELKAHGIYTIARVVCFKDPMLAEQEPARALCKPDGTPVTDGAGNAWVNPCDKAVWEHIVDAAADAGAAGFDEIQFDYVRFPVGEDADAAEYGVELTPEKKQEIITEFLNYALERLHGQHTVVGADLFGTVIGSAEDTQRVGQDFAGISGMLDVISPMIYPSHYENGTFGLDVPDAHPYETIAGAMRQADKAFDAMESKTHAVLRPWLQCFTAGWVDGHISYGREELRQQIQAVYDAGYEEWIFWNASNTYEKADFE